MGGTSSGWSTPQTWKFYQDSSLGSSEILPEFQLNYSEFDRLVINLIGPDMILNGFDKVLLGCW